MPQDETQIYHNLRASLTKVRVGFKNLYLVESDLLLTDSELRNYARAMANTQARLSVATDNYGNIIKWNKMPIRYAIDTLTFSPEEVAIVANHMQLATSGWESICGAKFERSCLLKRDFLVKMQDTRGALIAAAFFPNDPATRRFLIIDPCWFADTLKYDRTGVLRHELGHVLGFRHEHAREEASPLCPDEAHGDMSELTPYDSKSVMHYICPNGLGGDMALGLTELDKQGAQLIYGPPRVQEST